MHTGRHTSGGGPARRSAVVLPARLVALLLAFVLAMALPWLLPVVPHVLGGLVPAGGGPVTTPDPPVARAVAQPVTTGSTLRPSAMTRLAGKRLAAAGRPERLRVQRLGVHSPVVPISGQTGVLLPPSDPQLLGWWQEGAVPGAARGSAVLTGHTVHTGGGAFDHLRALVPGDVVVVRTARGLIRYTVVGVHIYTKRALARSSERVFRLTGPGRLVLVTCSNWNGVDYDTNTVVVARPVHVAVRLAGR
ncbi:MAG TPA: class F sortase [Marmoricola sp.]|nr:class F sortase [Marmoricola sp.]